MKIDAKKEKNNQGFTCGWKAKWADHHSGVLLKQWSWSVSPPKYIPYVKDLNAHWPFRLYSSWKRQSSSISLVSHFKRPYLSVDK